jgi:hypothetical protein
VKRSVEEERASIHTAMDRMYEGHDELSELLDDLLRAQAYELAEKQRKFFGDVSSQGNDGNWYGMSEWLVSEAP